MKHLTTEQLLKIVADNPVVKPRPTRNSNDVHRFIKDLDIRTGKHLVRNLMIYKTYALWSSAHSRIGRRGFFKRFSYYFSPVNTKSYRHYRINYRAVELLNKVDNGRIKF